MTCVECGHEFDHSQGDGEALLNEVLRHLRDEHDYFTDISLAID
jgi:hypothetical protein